MSEARPVPAHSGLAVLGSGVAAGLVASLAISALMLLAERTAMLPVGTFYMVLVSAVLPATDYGTYAIAQGLLLHLLAGAVLGLVMSAPFALSRKAYGTLGRLAPAYGLGAGALVWAALFIPVTFGTMLPLLQSLEGRPDIRQQAPAGDLFQVAFADLLAMTDRIIYTALAFHMLYGLLALIMTRAFAGALLERKKPQVIL
ncbi:MAG: hypothetical protein ACREAY_09585 [Nitrososphaera sp.]|uniref:hypothetical protein n=1 Tax=Nitrososphaera sp. TaxID=1971748 RepID=UPI003D6E6785